jgi:cytochrome c2
MTKEMKIMAMVISTIMLMFNTITKANPTLEVLSDCMACHTVSKPSEMTADERMNRIGPSLYYAGNKFKQTWLEIWLQTPTRLYPAGTHFSQYVEVTDEGDYVYEEDLISHPTLDQAQAKTVAAALMTLRAKSALVSEVKTDEIKQVSRRMGEMNFRKFKGCVSCHQDGIDEGGVSGPELYTAFNRLQLTYLISYIKDPTAWEPKSLMPNQHLKNKDIEKLVGYLKTIAEEE